MSDQKYTFDIIHLPHIVESVLMPLTKKCTIFTFQGPLGVGKTTLIQSFLKKLGVIEIITSPTFNYVNTYETENGIRIHHFDLYRIDSIEMFVGYGFDEYLYEPNDYVCIEWPEVIKPLLAAIPLAKKSCFIELEYKKNSLSQERLLNVHTPL